MNVVVMVYGPPQHARRAVNRARKLVGGTKTIVAVAASPAAAPAVSELPGVAKVGAVGRAGLREALDIIDDDSVLLVHDDVVITARGLAAMNRCHASGSRFVVPYTNDPVSDHYVGALPIDKEAEKNLDRLPAPSETKAVPKARAVCVLAAPHDLDSLLAEPVADPYALLDVAQSGFVVAGGALASHASRCVHSLVDDTDAAHPVLVASMIVKDEEEMLPECLESLRPIVDRIEICDTGSNDRTIEIARAAGANVIERDWHDDFGRARNQALEQCRDADYVLWVDADERVECADPSHMKRYLATYAAEHDAFSIDITNVGTDGGAIYSFSTARIFRAEGTEFRGALHEAVHLVGEPTPLQGRQFDQLQIVHHGYASDVINTRDKTERNLDIAEAQHAADGDARSAVHLARSLGYAGESPERALELLEQTWEASADAGPDTKAQILTLMADSLIELGNDERAFELAEQALELLPADDTAAAIIAATARRLGRLDELIRIADQISGAYSKRPTVRVEHNRLVFRGNLAVAYAEVGRLEEAVTEAFAVLESSTPFDGWDALVAAMVTTYGDASVEIMASLAAKDQSGAFLEPIVHSVSTATLARFSVAYNRIGGNIPEVTRVGLLAAAMAGAEDLFEALVPAAETIEPLTRVGLADRIAQQGRADLAEKLRQQPVVLKL